MSYGFVFEIDAAGQLASFVPPSEHQGAESDDEWFERLGFEPHACGKIGDDVYGELSWHRRADGASAVHQFAAWYWGVSDEVYLIFCKDWPALLRLQTMVAPVLTITQQQRLYDTLEPFVERFFRAFHGHVLGDACQQCDPSEFERQRALLGKARRVLGTDGQGATASGKKS